MYHEYNTELADMIQRKKRRQSERAARLKALMRSLNCPIIVWITNEIEKNVLELKRELG